MVVANWLLNLELFPSGLSKIVNETLDMACYLQASEL